MAQKEDKLCEVWDRLVLLLASQPREGWEDTFEAITRRELARLSAPNPAKSEDDDE